MYKVFDSQIQLESLQMQELCKHLGYITPGW